MKSKSLAHTLIDRVTNRLSPDGIQHSSAELSHVKRSLVIEALEPRILFSGSPAPAPEPAPAPVAAPAAQEAPSPAPQEASAPAAAEVTPVAAPPFPASSAESVPSAPEQGAGQGVEVVVLTDTEITALAEAASQIWNVSGLSADQSDALAGASYQIADLSGISPDALGSVEGNLITLDDDAAGHGWFVDSTPEENGSFALSEADLDSAGSSVDLLSALLHEQGHILGLLDDYGDSSNIMFGYLDAGERRLPEAGDAAGAVPGSHDGIQFLTFGPYTEDFVGGPAGPTFTSNDGSGDGPEFTLDGNLAITDAGSNLGNGDDWYIDTGTSAVTGVVGSIEVASGSNFTVESIALFTSDNLGNSFFSGDIIFRGTPDGGGAALEETFTTIGPGYDTVTFAGTSLENAAITDLEFEIVGSDINYVALDDFRYSTDDSGGGGGLVGELGILDLAANGGINPNTGVAWEAGDEYRLVFVTSGTAIGDKTDINFYNDFVQTTADAAGLGAATWNVIASTETVNARGNTSTQGTGGELIFLTDGSTVVANNYGDLWDGSLDNGINLDENGNSRNGVVVFTGTEFNSQTVADRWLGTTTISDNQLRVETGRSGDTGTRGWIRVFNAPPSSSQSLYALSEVLTVSAAGGFNAVDDDYTTSDQTDSDTVLNISGPGVFDNDIGVIPGAPIPITGVTIEDFSSENGGFGRLAVDTINGDGLNAGETEHNNIANDMWIHGPDAGNGDGNQTADITYDLEGNYDLDSVRVWNFNEVNLTNRAAKIVEISVASGVGSPFTSLGDFTLAQPPGTNGYTGELVDLSAFGAASNTRLIKFDIKENYGDDTHTGLAEVRFFEKAPTPATLLGFDATSAEGASVTVNPDGSFSYDPTGSATLQALGSGSSITDTFTYTIGGDLVPVTGVTIEDFSSENGGFQRFAVDTINGDGLNAEETEHNNIANDMWIHGPDTGNGDGNQTADITYDLEANYNLGSVRVWNFNEVNLTNRAAKTVEISVASSVGGPFTSLGDFTLAQPPGTNGYGGEFVDLSGFAAASDTRLIKFDIKENYGDDTHTGLAEVRFFALPADASTATVSIKVNGVADSTGPIDAVDDDYTASNPTDEDTVLTIGAAPNGLLNLDDLATGDHSFTADGQTFDAHVEQHDGSGWLLLGRGKQDWQFDTDGQGAVADVSQNLGSAAGNTTAAYSDAIVNDLLAEAGLTMADVEIRLKRANQATLDGSELYQDVRWRDFTGNGDAFTFDFDNSQYGINQEVRDLAGLTGQGGLFVNDDTNDTFQTAGDDADRVFTFSFQSEQGFSYGATNGVVPTDDWFTPYTEVYIRPLVEVPLQNATADFAQSGFPVTATIDDVYGNTGWAFAGGQNSPHAAVYETVTPLDQSDLTLRIDQPFPGHQLKKLRFSVTQDATPTAGGNWTELTPTSGNSQLGTAGITINGDNSVTLGNVGAVGNWVEIGASTPFGGITGIRLEVLTDGGSVGHAGNGNAVLTEFQVYAKSGALAGSSILDNDTPTNANIIAFDTTSAEGATVTVNPDGSFEYDPTIAPALQALNDGDMVTDTFTYTISDQNIVAGTIADENSAGAFAVANDDILNGIAPTETGSPLAGREGTSSDSSLLTNGAFGTPDFRDTTYVTIDSNTVLTYSLDTATNPGGYDISEIATYSGWQDSGRVQQNYTVSVATVGNPTVFTEIATVTNQGGGDNSGKVTISGSGILASSVGQIRFDFGPQQNGHVGYRELDVIGTASETATVSVKVNGVTDIVTFGAVDDDYTPANAVTVVNGDFESDTFTVFPGYLGGGNPGAITGWTYTQTSGGAGINPGGGAPFRNNGDNNTQVAFIQGQGELSQTINGLTPGAQYELTFDYNERANGGSTTVTATIAGETFTDTNNAPVQNANGFTVPYRQASLTFTATAASELLTLGSATNGGDQTGLFDNVAIAPVVALSINEDAAQNFPGQPTSLVGLWRFEGDFTDSSLAGNDGTGVNGVTFDVGQSGFGQAADFDGNDSHVLVSHDTSLDMTSTMTIAAWVNADGNTWEGVVAKSPSNGSGANHAGNYELRLENGSEPMNFLYQRGGANDTVGVNGGAATNVPTGSWQHVAVTVDGAGGSETINYYLNGSLVSTQSGADGFGATNTNPLYIGSRADLFTDFHGQMDDVAIFNEVLDLTQIASIMGGDFSEFIPTGVLDNDIGVAPAGPVTLISGVTVEDSSSELGAPFNRQADFVVDGSGLTGGAHGTSPDGSMWLSKGTFQAPNDPLPAHITFDLGANYDLDTFHVWNYNEAAAGLSTRGANLVEISVADSEGGSFTSLGDFNFAKATGLSTYAGETIDLSSFSEADDTRLIRFEIKNSHGGDNNFAGLSEVQFFGGTPAMGAITAFDSTSAKGAAVIVNADGSFSYDPTGSATLQSLAQGESTTDTFTYTISDSGDPISYVGITNDADSGIDSSKTYTHKLDFGTGSPGAVINGVQFDAYNNAADGTLNFSRTVSSGSESHHGGNGNHNVSGGLASLMTDMYYNGGNAPGGTTTWTLGGLTAGQSYETRIYTRAWSGGAGNRDVTIEFDPDGTGSVENSTVTIKEDDARTVGLDNFNDAYYISYQFTAVSGEDLVITATQDGSNASWHLYGLSNEEIPALSTDTATVTVQVDGVNDAPVILPDSDITYRAITGDADSGIDSSKTYTHAIDFGNQPGDSPVATVNGVVFANGSPGNLPGLVTGASHTVGTGSTNIPNSHPGNNGVDSLIDGDLEDLVDDFLFNNPTTEVTLTGLTPGEAYQLTLYNRRWGGERDQEISFDTNGDGIPEHTGRFDADDATEPDANLGTANQPFALDYNYVLAPGQTSLTININRIGNVGTYHIYGLTNEVIPGVSGLSGEVVETADNSDPADATGTITFGDVDLSDTHTASVLTASVTGGTASLTTAQENALLDNLSLGAVQNDTPADGFGQVTWTYDVPNSEVDFLGVGETVEVTHTVAIGDGLTVANGDFETDADLFDTFPGYISNPANPDQITDWTFSGTGQAGVNPGDGAGAPFRNNGDNSTNVAFIQANGSISQTINGLTAGQTYALTFDYNERANGGSTTVTATIGGETFTDPNNSPVGGSNPYREAFLKFTATGTSETLTISGATNSGDQTTLIDNVEITAFADVVITITGTNDVLVIDSPPQTGSITETADNTDPADATGTITFDDPDLSDTPTAQILPDASVTGGTVTLTTAQENALLDNLSLGTVADNPDGSGSVVWTYDVPNAEINFFAAGETAELTHTVAVSDEGAVFNGDFETDANLFDTFPGYISNPANPAQITGWSHTGQAGINPGNGAGAPFRDNGDNSTNVAFIQGAGSLSQTIEGLTVGQEYVLTFDYNERSTNGGGTTVTATIAGQNFTDTANNPVGGSNPYRQAILKFTATGTSETLTISSASNGGDQTTLIDNVRMSTAQDVVITINGTNDAPVLNTGVSANMNDVSISDMTNDGDLVSDLYNNGISDVDNGSVEGIAITGAAVPTGTGYFEYSSDGGTNWLAVGTVSDSSALLLLPTDRVRFVPDGVTQSGGTLIYRAWDQTGGTDTLVHTKVDASTNGGTTPFSTATATATAGVYNVVIDNGEIIYTAADGEVNDIRVSIDPVTGELLIVDANGNPVTTGEADSDTSGNGIGIAYSGEDLTIETNVEDDIIRFGAMAGFTGSITADGGADSDRIESFRTEATLRATSSIDMDAEEIKLMLSSFTAGGDIDLNGTDATGAATGTNYDGIWLYGTDLETTVAGSTITLAGEGGDTGTYNNGIKLTNGSDVTTADGDIDIDGAGGGNALFGTGVALHHGSSVSAGGNGALTIDGTAGAGSSFNEGVFLSTYTSATVADGDLTITGTGNGTGSQNQGVDLSVATLTATGTGNIAVIGSGSGSGTGTHNTGVTTNATDITTTTGTVTLAGTGGGGTSNNQGVRLAATDVTTTGGSIDVDGTGNGTAVYNTGVQLVGSTLEAGGAGTIDIDGTAGNGTVFNEGVQLSAGSTVKTDTGTIGIRGTGMGTITGNRGVTLISSTAESTGGGDITLRGTASAASIGALNDGISLSYSHATTTGTLTMAGTGGAGSVLNSGVKVVGGSLSGTLDIDGTGGGTAHSNAGVYIMNTDLGSASGTITGTGGAGSGVNFGAFMQGIIGGFSGTVTTDPDEDEEKGGNFFSTILPLALMAGADRRSKPLAGRVRNENKFAATETGNILRSLFARLREHGNSAPSNRLGNVPVYRSFDGHLALNPEFVDGDILDAALRSVDIQLPQAPIGITPTLVLIGDDASPLVGLVAYTDQCGELISSLPISSRIEITIAEFAEAIRFGDPEETTWSPTGAIQPTTHRLHSIALEISELFDLS